MWVKKGKMVGYVTLLQLPIDLRRSFFGKTYFFLSLAILSKSEKRLFRRRIMKKGREQKRKGLRKLDERDDI